MKILKVNPYIRTFYIQTYKRSIVYNINKFINTKSMKEILKEYSIDDLKLAIDSLYLSGNYICSPNGTKSDKILRLLQYGGYNIKALNILTLSSIGL